jgi:hypothetical protein
VDGGRLRARRLRERLAYAKTRQQFGRPIGGFQLVQDLLVRMLGNVTSAYGLCVRLSQLPDEGLAEDRHSSLAKAFCTLRMRENRGLGPGAPGRQWNLVGTQRRPLRRRR